MTVDPYQPCPCGSSKKIKFCCCGDIVEELEKVLRMVEGEQRLACLQRIDQLLTKYPGRAALLSFKVMLHFQLDQLEQVEQTVNIFLEKSPDNPVALAQSAMLKATQGGALAGVEALQRAIELCDQFLSPTVRESIGAVGRSLLDEGFVLAAQGHLLLQAALSAEDDKRAESLLSQLDKSPQVPLLLKEVPVYAECPEGAPWKTEFDAAVDLGRRGAWHAAIQRLSELPDWPPGNGAILRNVAIMRRWLGDLPAMTKALRDYASIEDVPLDNAVEAEALAQLFDTEQVDSDIDVVCTTYPVSESDALGERLVLDQRTLNVPFDPQHFDAEDGPPPKSVHILLERPMPSSGTDLALDMVPRVIGQMYLFGKQTDRDARLDLVVSRTDDFATKQNIAADVLSDFVGAAEKQDVASKTTSVADALAGTWRLPDDTPPGHREELLARKRQEILLDRWPELKLGVLDDKTATEVAGDPSYRGRVLAAMLLLELSAEQMRGELDYNKLRAKLGLPTLDGIDPSQVDLATLPLVRLSRLDTEKLSDEQLVSLYHSVASVHATRALRNLAKEVTRREHLGDKINIAGAYGLLSQLASNGSEGIALAKKSQDVARSHGQSPAKWYIYELTRHLERGDVRECQRLTKEIQSRHINEPGIARMLLDVLVQFGVVNPDGKPGEPSDQPVAAEEASGESGQLWTPDSQESGGEKPKLWTPGMS